jgi:hypothetical protein
MGNGAEARAQYINQNFNMNTTKNSDYSRGVSVIISLIFYINSKIGKKEYIRCF